MNATLLLIVSVLYLAQGVYSGLTINPWWFGFWSAYAFANICWIMAPK